jgi:AraC-like DNA-binding protein
MGGYANHTTLGERHVSSPAVTLYRAREPHANFIGAYGFEQIQIEFDPDWLELPVAFPADPVRAWIGGPVAVSARSFGAIWDNPDVSEIALRKATETFLGFASTVGEVRRPPWLSYAESRLSSEAPPSTKELARELGMNSGWLAEAYREAVGEGVGETMTRRRVEIATNRLRSSTSRLADIAAESGFCDQSHMARAFRRWMGRTPLQVRLESAVRSTNRPDQFRRLA